MLPGALPQRGAIPPVPGPGQAEASYSDIPLSGPLSGPQSGSFLAPYPAHLLEQFGNRGPDSGSGFQHHMLTQAAGPGRGERRNCYAHPPELPTNGGNVGLGGPGMPVVGGGFRDDAAAGSAIAQPPPTRDFTNEFKDSSTYLHAMSERQDDELETQRFSTRSQLPARSSDRSGGSRRGRERE